MAKRIWTVERINEIKRLINEGLSDRKIAKVLHCRRQWVAEIRQQGEAAVQGLMSPPLALEPAWAEQVTWPVILEEIRSGFEIKRIWEERVFPKTSYSNFWKHLTRRYPALLQDTISLREFKPGTHCEVDWAGDKIEWWDQSGRRSEAHVFVGILCFSQLIFAFASENEKQSAWLTSHQKMYEFFGGVPHVTVPDNLKTGTKKAHRYDPDLNPAYTELATHYQTAIVPARVASPRDKALVENAVGLVMRLFRWKNRHRRFYSLEQVNQALRLVIDQLNTKPHTRLKVSRQERWGSLEKNLLKPLPATPFEQIEWKVARVHPDCTISVEGNFYSVPHLHRGKEVRVKLTARQIEVFLNLERIALHPRNRSHHGVRVLNPEHLPENTLAYREATPQNLLSQARFVNPALYDLFNQLFSEDALGHLRRAQGLLRHARNEISCYGSAQAQPRITQAIEEMRRFNKIRVSYFDQKLKQLRLASTQNTNASYEIQRKLPNPMLRSTPTAEAAEHHPQLTLLPERTKTSLWD